MALRRYVAGALELGEGYDEMQPDLTESDKLRLILDEALGVLDWIAHTARGAWGADGPETVITEMERAARSAAAKARDAESYLAKGRAEGANHD